MLKNNLTLCMILSLASHLCTATPDVILPTDAAQTTGMACPTGKIEERNEGSSQNYNNGYSTQKYDKKYNNNYNNKYNNNNRYNGPTLTEKAEKWHNRNEENFAAVKQEQHAIRQELLDVKQSIAALREELKKDISHIDDLIMAQHAQEAEPLFEETETKELEKSAEVPQQTTGKKMKKKKEMVPQPITAEELTEIEEQV